MIIVCLILVAIAGIAKAIMDTLQFHFSGSVFKNRVAQFWNPAISWENQHTTWLPAFLTDAWHLFQSIFLMSLFVAFVSYSGISNNWYQFAGIGNMIVDFIIIRSVFGLFFVLFYNYLLIKK